MNLEFSLQILFEVFLVLALVYGYKHEEDLIELETVLKWYVKKQFRTFKERMYK